MQTLRKPQFWIGIGISILCLVAIFTFVEPSEIVKALRQADYGNLAIGVCFILIYMVLRAVRWRYLLENKISLRDVFHLQNIGYMLTQVLPLRVGDPARAVLVGNVPPLTVAQGLSTMVVERLLDMLAIVTILPFTLSTVPSLPSWMREGARASGIVALAAIVVLVVAANFRPKATALLHTILQRIRFPNPIQWAQRADDLLAGLVTLTSWRTGSILIILSILPWLPITLGYQYVMFAVGLQPDVIMAAFVVCAGALSIAAPSSPGQVGVFHAGVTAAITFLGMDATQGASFGFLYHAANFILLITLGVLGLWLTQATLGQTIANTTALIRRQ